MSKIARLPDYVKYSGQSKIFFLPDIKRKFGFLAKNLTHPCVYYIYMMSDNHSVTPATMSGSDGEPIDPATAAQADHQNSPETAQIDPKPVKELNLTQQAYILLRNEGATQRKAAAAVGYHPAYAPTLERNLAKYSLKQPKKLKHASKVIDGILDGSIQAKDSTRLAAAGMVYDRVEPAVRRNESVSVSINYDVPVEVMGQIYPPNEGQKVTSPDNRDKSDSYDFT